jgi:hypothetical protein
MRFCTKCGASLAEGAGHCRLCRAPVGLAVAGAVASAGAVATASSTDGNPWVTIWLHPRRTIRAILNRDVTYMVLAIAAVGGISQVLGRMADRNAADKISFPVILLMGHRSHHPRDSPPILLEVSPGRPGGRDPGLRVRPTTHRCGLISRYPASSRNGWILGTIDRGRLAPAEPDARP